MITQGHAPLKANELSYIIEAEIRGVTVQEVLHPDDEEQIKYTEEPAL